MRWYARTLCFLLCGVCAADEYLAVSWDAEDGLPHNAVYEIVQGPDGYIWLATSGGLARFDGFEFRRIDSPLLKNRESDSIRPLAVTREGNILAGPRAGGLVRVSRTRVSNHPVSRLMGQQRIADLFCTRNNGIWFSLPGGVVHRWHRGESVRVGKLHQSGSGTVTISDVGGELWIAVGDFLGVWRDDRFHRRAVSVAPSYHLAPGRGSLWVAGNDGLCNLVDGIETMTVPWPAAMSEVKTMLEDSNGVLWVGTVDSGLFRFDGDGFVRGPVTHPEVAALLEDREGNIWAGTVGGGVYLIRRRRVGLFDSQSGLPQDVSFSICESDDGGVWFANRSGGLVRQDSGRGHPTAFKLPGNYGPTVVVQAPDEGLYVGADSGLYYFDSTLDDSRAVPVEALAGEAVRCLFRSRTGEVWVSTNSNSLGVCRGRSFRRVTLETADDAVVSAIADDAEGRVILGTTGGEIFRLESDRFRPLALGGSGRFSTIMALLPHRDGSLWIGTSADGLVWWRDGESRHFDRRHGLPDESISQLVWENSETLWAGSRTGVWRLPLDQVRRSTGGNRLYPLLLGRADGALRGSCIGSHQPACFKAADGTLWFATRRGTMRVDPAGFDAKPRAIPVFVEAIIMDGVRRDAAPEMRGVPLGNRYELEYTALHFSAPDRLRFRHRLDGYDADWVNAEDSRRAVYSHLPPGEYRFDVEVRSPRGDWGENFASLTLVVPPAWWQRPALRAGFAGALAVALLVAVRTAERRRFRQKIRFMEQEQLLEAERDRIARDLHDELGAELTHLVHLGHCAVPEATPEELQQTLATVSRKAEALSVHMDAIVWTVNPKNDTLPELTSYLSQIGREFFRSFPVRWRVDRPLEFPGCPVSPECRHHVLMIVREALHNVAKHSRATEVWFRMWLDSGDFRMEIADNGVGMNGEPLDHSGNGLRNMRSRAEEMGARLAINSCNTGGTTVSLTLPLPLNSHA